MGRKKPTKSNFIDEVKRFSSYENNKIGDWVVYTRISDEKVSVGEVRWFCMTSEGMAVTVIDKNLGNFQLGLCNSIEENPTSTRIQSLVSIKKDIPKKTK